MSIVLYTILSVILVSLISLVGAASLLLKKESLNKILLSFVSLSAGTLLGGAFLHLLPQAVNVQGFTLQLSLLVLAGVLTFFILEKFVHLHSCEVPHVHKFPLVHQPHKHHIGIVNLVGDGLHNLLDGLIIAGGYLISIPVGVATTVAVIFHEVPQELGDFGVLLYSGYSKMKALFLNFLTATIAIIGAIIGLVLGAKSTFFVNFILPFAAGGFIYIAGANLIPELHKECDLRNSFWHLFAFVLGIAIMVALIFLE